MYVLGFRALRDTQRVHCRFPLVFCDDTLKVFAFFRAHSIPRFTVPFRGVLSGGLLREQRHAGAREEVKEQKGRKKKSMTRRGFRVRCAEREIGVLMRVT